MNYFSGSNSEININLLHPICFPALNALLIELVGHYKCSTQQAEQEVETL